MAEPPEGADDLSPHIKNFFLAFGNTDDSSSKKKLSLTSDVVPNTNGFPRVIDNGPSNRGHPGNPSAGYFPQNFPPLQPMPTYAQPRPAGPSPSDPSRFWFMNETGPPPPPQSRDRNWDAGQRGPNGMPMRPPSDGMGGLQRLWQPGSGSDMNPDSRRRLSDGTTQPATAQQLDDYLEKMLSSGRSPPVPRDYFPGHVNSNAQQQSLGHNPQGFGGPVGLGHGPAARPGGGGMSPHEQAMYSMQQMAKRHPPPPPPPHMMPHQYQDQTRGLDEQFARGMRLNTRDDGLGLGDDTARRRVPSQQMRDEDENDADRIKRAPKPLPDISALRRLELEDQIQDILNRLQPTEAELHQRQAMLQKIDQLVQKEWKGAYVRLYGSSGNQFGLRGADLDMCLFVTLGADDTNASIITRLGEILENEGHKDVLPLPDTRVPIVKFRERDSGLPIDICLNNYLALNNTEFLSLYAQIDSRLIALSHFVKYWAKRRKINEPYLGTLSSYAYVLLCIYYLQTRPNPVLPNLQAIPPPGQSTCPVQLVNDFDCYYYKDLDAIYKMGYGPNSRNRESLAELLVGFFHYFAYNFDYHEHVVSVRLATLVTKEKKEWTLKHNTRHNRYWLCIEDPFEMTHNLGRVADRNTLYDIRGEFMRAYRVFNNGGAIDELCSAYETQSEDGMGRKEAREREPRDMRSPNARSPRGGKAVRESHPSSPSDSRTRTTSTSSDGARSPRLSRGRTTSRSSDNGNGPREGSPSPPPRPKPVPINRKPGQHSSHRQYRDPSAKAYQKSTVM